MPHLAWHFAPHPSNILSNILSRSAYAPLCARRRLLCSAPLHSPSVYDPLESMVAPGTSGGSTSGKVIILSAAASFCHPERSEGSANAVERISDSFTLSVKPVPDSGLAKRYAIDRAVTIIYETRHWQASRNPADARSLAAIIWRGWTMSIA